MSIGLPDADAVVDVWRCYEETFVNVGLYWPSHHLKAMRVGLAQRTQANCLKSCNRVTPKKFSDG